MRTLGIDSGIITTGWAVLGGLDSLIACDVVRPEHPAARVPERIESLCQQLEALLDEYQPDLIILEWDSGKVNPRRHKGHGQGLATHGAVTSALWRESLHWARRRAGVTVVTVDENQWTRGVPKEYRAAAVAQMFPAVDWTRDKRHDAADAVAMALWQLKELCVRSVDNVQG